MHSEPSRQNKCPSISTDEQPVYIKLANRPIVFMKATRVAEHAKRIGDCALGAQATLCSTEPDSRLRTQNVA